VNTHVANDVPANASSDCLRIVLPSGIIDVIAVKDGKEINVWILCRFDEFDENVLFIVLFEYDAFLQMLTGCVNRFASPFAIWVVHAWLDVSTQA